MPRLTKQQRQVLQTLTGVTSMGLDALAHATGRPREGLAVTASSLVKKGFVERWYDRTRHVRYAATSEGVRQVAAR